MRKRRRITQKKVEIVSSTAFALQKNPNMYDNVKEYTPDHKEKELKKMAKADAKKKAKHESTWAKIQEEMRKL